MQFTKDTSVVIASIYKVYLERRDNGISRDNAKSFSEDFYKSISNLSNWSDDDISDCIDELEHAGFAKTYITGDFEIKNELIIQMENRFNASIKNVGKYIADLIAGIATSLIF